MLTVYNTLGRRLEPFEPRQAGKVSMYVCGPTVQSEPHLGHGRFAVVFDMIRRYLRWRGFEVTYVRNVTDVEDKIIAAAVASGETMEARAERMVGLFHATFAALGVESPDVEPRATRHIPQMIELIEQLIDKGLAYPAGNGDVYFSVRGLESQYGKLSGRNVDDLRAGVRIEVNEAKLDPLDFALWKASKPGEPAWDSPWEPGRPGWHIECSAMASEYLGAGFDIHGGGSDLIFPHHENEIAQSEGASGGLFARYWLHNGMVNLEGEKMSKSTGHVIDLAGAIDEFGGVAVRLLYLRAHYRSPLEFSEALVGEAKDSLERIRRVLERAPRDPGVEPDAAVLDRFRAAMDDDFGTPDAIGGLFDAVREANRLIDLGGDPASMVAAVDEIVDVLGIRPFRQVFGSAHILLQDHTSGAEGIVKLLAERDAARIARDFVTADRIRDELATRGIVIEDGAGGTRWHRK